MVAYQTPRPFLHKGIAHPLADGGLQRLSTVACSYRPLSLVTEGETRK